MALPPGMFCHSYVKMFGTLVSSAIKKKGERGREANIFFVELKWIAANGHLSDQGYGTQGSPHARPVQVGIPFRRLPWGRAQKAASIPGLLYD